MNKQIKRVVGKPCSCGAVNLFWLLALVSAGVAMLLFTLLFLQGRKEKAAGEQLTLYCAAGLRVPVEAICQAYEEEYGVTVQIQFGGSKTLLGQLEVNRQSQADLYLAGDAFYTGLAREKGLVAEVLPLAYMRPVLAVKKGNPKGIKSILDMTRQDVRVVLANPDQAAIGREVAQTLTALMAWRQLSEYITRYGAFKPTVNEVANDLKLGTADAGFIWNATAQMPQYRDALETIELQEFAQSLTEVSLGVLKASPRPRAALHFARYLSARDKGLPHFSAYGFEVIEGDRWEDHPELTFFCGAVNRRAVEAVIKAFEDREGVTVNTVYNGCGILTGQMKVIRNKESGQGFPDVYMACDRYYLENVREWFQEDADISDAAIVIAVPKGNPKGITSLADLTQEGMRVAVGQPEQCTIGALTRIMLEKLEMYDAVMARVVTQTASSSMLIPSVTTKSVDAAIAYITDTKAEADKVDAVRIDSPDALAIQPFALARSSEFKQLGRRLFEAVAAARDRFESAGFHFRYEAAAGGVQ